MHSFRILTDAVLLHLAQKPLIVLAIVFLAILAVTVVLVGRQLRRQSSAPPEHAEDDPCC
jgi:hypothetical protein